MRWKIATLCLIGVGLISGCGARSGPAACIRVAPTPEQMLRTLDEADALAKRSPAKGQALARAVAQGTFAEACVQRWSYRLAAAGEPPAEVAQAAVGACWGPIGMWNDLWSQVEDIRYVSRATGADVTVEAAHTEELVSKARFWVIKARAGACGAD